MPQDGSFHMNVDGREIDLRVATTNGIILIVGPTGSGKITTLYGALQAINSEAKNITTVEDPVEYHIDGITQIQVNADLDIRRLMIVRANSQEITRQAEVEGMQPMFKEGIAKVALGLTTIEEVLAVCDEEGLL